MRITQTLVTAIAGAYKNGNKNGNSGRSRTKYVIDRSDPAVKDPANWTVIEFNSPVMHIESCKTEFFNHVRRDFRESHTTQIPC